MQRRRTDTRAFRIHLAAFVVGVCAFAAADFLGGEPGWSVWPIGLWAVAFGVHYLFYKTRTVNEQWAEERAADLHSKSYDASHIDDIAARYDVEKPDQKPK